MPLFPISLKLRGRLCVVVGGGVIAESKIQSLLAAEAHVVVVPGEAFGTDAHIRLSYAVSGDVIDKGVQRMREYLSKLS